MTGASAGSAAAANTSSIWPRGHRSICRSAISRAAARHSSAAASSGIAAEAARKARDAFLDRLAAAVERGVLVDAVGQLAEDAAHVGHVGEAAGGEPLLRAAERRPLRHDADVGARQPGVDELAGR